MIEVDRLMARNLLVLSLVLPPGLTAVIGLNGAGKTTLLEVCSGLLLPESGAVRVDGRAPRAVDAGWVSAAPCLFSRVQDELSASSRFVGVPPAEAGRRAREAAEATGAVEMFNRSTRTLSGGERSVVVLAAALAGRPTLLALDEFDGHIDPDTLAELLPAVRSSGARYILWSTHDPALAAAADHVVALEEGRVASTGPAALALFDAWEQEVR